MITTDTGAKKIEGTDNWRLIFDAHNDSVDAHDQAIAKVQNGLAYIVGNTNTTGSTLSTGQFVYVKGHSTIAEGLRTVTASISANGDITTNNTSACSEGGLNALNSKFKIVTGTTGSSANADSKVANLPSGWNSTNCVCIGSTCKNSNGNWYGYPTNKINVDVNGIYANVQSGFTGQTIKIILYKFA